MSAHVVTTAGIIGLTAQPLIVTAHRSLTPGIQIIGPTDAALSDTTYRIGTALTAPHVALPHSGQQAARSLTAAPLHTDAHDLAYAVALTRSDSAPHLTAAFLARVEADGRLSPVRGIYPLVASLAEHGTPEVYVAPSNAAEARLVDGITVHALPTLADVLASLDGLTPVSQPSEHQASAETSPQYLDLATISGNHNAVQRAILAVTGGHSIHLRGDVPKADAIAQAVAALLPPLSEQDSHTATAIASVRGTLTGRRITTAPYVVIEPHTSMAALIGGGTGVAKPGAISGAHAGMLHVSNAYQLPDAAWSALHQPRQFGAITLHRSSGVVTYPAKFQLVMTTYDCPCNGQACQCTPQQRSIFQRRKRAAAPFVALDALVETEITPTPYMPTSEVAHIVTDARNTAIERYREPGWTSNQQATRRWLTDNTPRAIVEAVRTMIAAGSLTMTGGDDTLRAAWTAADIAGAPVPSFEHLSQVI